MEWKGKQGGVGGTAYQPGGDVPVSGSASARQAGIRGAVIWNRKSKLNGKEDFLKGGKKPQA